MKRIITAAVAVLISMSVMGQKADLTAIRKAALRYRKADLIAPSQFILTNGVDRISENQIECEYYKAKATDYEIQFIHSENQIVKRKYTYPAVYRVRICGDAMNRVGGYISDETFVYVYPDGRVAGYDRPCNTHTKFEINITEIMCNLAIAKVELEYLITLWEMKEKEKENEVTDSTIPNLLKTEILKGDLKIYNLLLKTEILKGDLKIYNLCGVDIAANVFCSEDTTRIVSECYIVKAGNIHKRVYARSKAELAETVCNILKHAQSSKLILADSIHFLRKIQ